MPLAPLSRRRKVNLSTVLGELVQTTNGKWITRAPLGARVDTASARIKPSSATSLASGTAAGTTYLDLPGDAIRRCTGHLSTRMHDAGRAGDCPHFQPHLNPLLAGGVINRNRVLSMHRVLV
jgi:hypothetical protein